MQIPDNVLRLHLKNVYFIWGSGKTTAANALAQLCGGYVYHTDESRAHHCKNADPRFQPAFCRDIPDYWALEPADALEWEGAIVREMTPMIIAELIALAALHERVFCEGDIDIGEVVKLTENSVSIVNLGDSGDFFDRPEQRSMLDEIMRSGFSDDEKARRFDNAYRIVGAPGKKKMEEPPPDSEIYKYGVKRIDRDNSSTPEETARLIAAHFGIPIMGGQI